MANLQIMKHYVRHPREFFLAVLHKLWSIRPIRMVGATLRNLLHVNRIEKRVGELEQQNVTAEIGRIKKQLGMLETRPASPAAEMLGRAETIHAEKLRNDPQRQVIYGQMEEKARALCGDALQILNLTGKDGVIFLKNCQSSSIDLIKIDHLAGCITVDEFISILEDCERVLTEYGLLTIEEADPECTEGYHILCDPVFGTVLHPEAMKMMIRYTGLSDKEIVRIPQSDDGCADYILVAGKKLSE